MASVDEELGRELGVHPGLVASMRRDSLREGVDWIREDGGRVVLQPEGRERLLSLLGTPQKFEGGAGEKAAGGPVALSKPVEGGDSGPPVQARLRIVRLMPNPLWIAVERPDRRMTEVRVRRREGLRPGVLLLCQQLPDGRWECVQKPHAMAMPELPKKERGAV